MALSRLIGQTASIGEGRRGLRRTWPLKHLVQSTHAIGFCMVGILQWLGGLVSSLGADILTNKDGHCAYGHYRKKETKNQYSLKRPTHPCYV